MADMSGQESSFDSILPPTVEWMLPIADVRQEGKVSFGLFFLSRGIKAGTSSLFSNHRMYYFILQQSVQ